VNKMSEISETPVMSVLLCFYSKNPFISDPKFQVSDLSDVTGVSEGFINARQT